MTLQTDGFLSTDAPSDPIKLEPSISPFSELAVGVNRFLVALVKEQRDPPKSAADELMIALMGRLVHDFEAAVLLANRGFRAQSRSMARSTLETAIYCVAACRDLVLSQGTNRRGTPATFVAAFIGAHERFRKRVAMEISALAETTPETKARLDELVKELRDAGPVLDVNLEGLTQDLGLFDLYTVLYRPLSQDSHPSATSVGHHFEVDATGQSRGFRIGPDYEQYGDTILAAVAAALLASEAFIAKAGTLAEENSRSMLFARYRFLAEQT